MTRVDKIKVTGLAGRDTKIDIDLNPEVNVIFGLNGRGKTSLLKIIDSGLSGTDSALSGIPFKSAEITFYSENHKASFTRKTKLQRQSSWTRCLNRRCRWRDH